MANRIGKGKGNDATQDVSLSQFVPPKPPASLTKPPMISRGSQKNDMSLWGGVVVGTSDFAPAPTKKVRSNAWKWIAGGGAVLGIAIAAVFLLRSDDTAPASTAAATSPAPAVVPDQPPAEKPPEKPAEKPAEPPAATSGSGSAAAPAVAALTGSVDAISGVAPVIKPKPVAKKKLPARKKTAKAVVKKKLVPKKKK